MLVIVPFYNCEQWLGRALTSLSQQDLRARVVLMDDASDDESSAIAQRFARPLEWAYVRNATNKKCPYNIWWAMNEYGGEADEPVLILDGDDYLPHDGVLSRIAEVYRDPNVWLTYGGYESDPYDPNCNPAMMYPDDVIAQRSYRRHGNLFNHPLTWRTWLFRQLPVSQLQTPDGAWFRSGYDRAIMWPLLEMATEWDGTAHWRMISQSLYVYNSINPQSEVHVNLPAFHEAECCVNYPVMEPACPPR